MGRLHLSDTARANWSFAAAGVLGLVASVPLTVSSGREGLDGEGLYQVLTFYYLVTWPLFVGTYLLWTHLTYSRFSPSALDDDARRETVLHRRWYSRLLGYGSATSWTMSAAFVAVVITVVVTQTPVLQGTGYVLLSLLAVASSWALMVYSFALAYVRLNAATPGTGGRHVDLHVEDAAEFGDYLTLALLLSTMAATISASIKTREAWRLVRANVVLAFVFNSVILAMVISLLFGGLVSGTE